MKKIKNNKKEKPILDACCGSKMFWFDQHNPNAIFGDIRTLETTLCDGRTLSISPDLEMDFRDIPYASNSFKLVVFDPPHMKNLGVNSWMAKKYGVLEPTWKDDLRIGFSECMRVLDKYRVLIFKWNEDQIKVSEIISIFGEAPLFGHRSGKQSKTIWMAFMNLPKVKSK